MTTRIVTLFILLSFATLGWSELIPTEKHRRATSYITDVIERYHYKHVVLNDDLSEHMWKKYLDSLDPNHNVFLQSDIDGFSDYREGLDDALLRADLKPAYAIYNLYHKRLSERVDFAISLLEKDFDFSVDEQFVFDRSEKPWPKNLKEAQRIWLKRVKNEFLSLRIAGKTDKEVKTTLRKRYERLIRNIDQWRAEDVFQVFINAYTQTIEPHTAYFSPRTSENFRINMSLSLEGIGAALSTENEYTTVQRIIKGGPADLNGELAIDDKIIGVAQGKKNDFQDVVGYRLLDVVDLIRGPKGSVVRLQVLPKGIGPEGPAKTITLVRNKIKLEEQAAKSSVIETEKNGKKLKIGVVDIPAFYLDFDARSRGDKDFRSTTRDVKKLLAGLEKDGIDGLIIDLRGNGGGSLIEATSLTGLFIESGPIVQVKHANGEVKVNVDPSPDSIYSGPLAVLVDRYSASASEIFAGAIQDYRRGIVIGEPTFGKGTVQTLIDLNQFQPHSTQKLGQLKITMAQFFRVNGDSTQFRGVVPDIAYPTSIHSDNHGERGLENALPWARIKAAKFNMDNLQNKALTYSKNLYLKRTSKDHRFHLLKEESKKQVEALNRVSVSLLETKRRKEQEELEKTQKDNMREFKTALGLDPEAEEDKNKDEDDTISRFLLQEAAEILSDYISFARQRTIVQSTSRSVN